MPICLNSTSLRNILLASVHYICVRYATILEFFWKLYVCAIVDLMCPMTPLKLPTILKFNTFLGCESSLTLYELFLYPITQRQELLEVHLFYKYVHVYNHQQCMCTFIYFISIPFNNKQTQIQTTSFYRNHRSQWISYHIWFDL